jgi:hypothetical protein
MPSAQIRLGATAGPVPVGQCLLPPPASCRWGNDWQLLARPAPSSPSFPRRAQPGGGKRGRRETCTAPLVAVNQDSTGTSPVVVPWAGNRMIAEGPSSAQGILSLRSSRRYNVPTKPTSNALQLTVHLRENNGMTADKERKCPDCGAAMHEIRVIDKGPRRHYDLEYTTCEAKRSYWLKCFPVKGAVRAVMCQDCHRIILFGEPA